MNAPLRLVPPASPVDGFYHGRRVMLEAWRRLCETARGTVSDDDLYLEAQATLTAMVQIKALSDG